MCTSQEKQHINVNTLKIYSGKEMGDLRKQCRISQQDFADLIGVDRTYLSKVENGRAEPSLRLIDQAESKINDLVKTHKCAVPTNYRTSKPDVSIGDNVVRESLTDYGRKRLAVSSDSESVLNINPKYSLENEAAIKARDKVIAFLRPWLNAAQVNEEVGPAVLHVLRKHLPHVDLELYGIDLEEVERD